ncbi:MAG: Bug family tripartite tricarboxylate transporter substrate binding protein, partial [Lautropia sp.]
RPGGGGVLGTDVALRAAGDGNTLLFGATYNLATNVTLVRNLSYDPLRAFSMITRLFDSNWFLVVHPRLGLGSIPELVEYAKRNPGRLNYASFGNGNGSHLAMELFKSMVGARIVHIPYQTPGGAVVDLLAGRTDLAFLSPDSLPHVANGSLKAIGFTGAARSPLMPSVPTMAEAVPGYFYTSWGGVVAPAGVPAPVVSKLNSAYIAALAQNDVRERLRELGAEPMPSTPEAFHTLVRAEIPRLGQLIRNSGVKLD